MRLIIALAGSGDITEKNAETLLNDFIDGRETVLFVPNYITQEQEGLRTVLNWWGSDYYKIRKGMLLSKFDDLQGEYAFVVLGTEGLEDLIGQAQRAGFPVLDLCRGLFQITEALDGVESNAEALSEPPEGDEPQEESDLVTDDPSASDPWTGTEYMTRDEVKELVMTLIQVHERMYHNGVPMDLPPAIADIKEAVAEIQQEASGTEPNYYRSKTGKHRPMGKTKARPGEVPVYLTQEEIDGLNN